MTPERRYEILSGEFLRADDIAELHSISLRTASDIIRFVKSKSDRFGMAGAVHIQDYIDAYELSVERFLVPRRAKYSYEYDVDKSIAYV